MNVFVYTKDKKEYYPGVIGAIHSNEYSDNMRWFFPWLKEIHHPSYEVLKLCIRGNDKIHGLISFEHRLDYLYVRYLESHLDHQHNPSGLMIGPSLIAAASYYSFHYGYDGFVSIHIKHHPRLIKYYTKLGAKVLSGDHMYLDTIASKHLLDVYWSKGDR